MGGIRLYPNVSHDDMERLAGVPAGTWDRLQASGDIIKLHDFKTFGWGRMKEQAIEYIEENFNGVRVGSTDNPSHSQALIRAMGITAEGITSVRWS